MSGKSGKQLGEILKEALREKGLNQTAVAKKMNVSKQVINQIDRRKYFDLDFLVKFKEATGLDFTRYSTAKSLESAEEVKGDYALNSQTVEMSLAIKIRAHHDEIVKMGELVTAFKKEALRLGFSIS